MEMNERKRKILHTIINEYVTKAEPVGSRHIAKNLDMGLSSATIRNEMADLEEMGYLEQPHTSAGRIPSDKGYRFYVNELMSGYEMSKTDMDLLAGAMEMKLTQFDKVIRQASVLLSQLTNYTAVLMTPEMKHGAIKTIELIPVDAASMLVILVTNEGIMKNKRVYMPQNMKADMVSRVSSILKEHLSGLLLHEIDMRKITDIKKALGINYEMIFPILDFISDIVDDIRKETEIYLSGATNIFNFPEYKDVSRAREFLEFLDDKNSIVKVLSEAGSDEEHDVRIRIGKENGLDIMQNLSLVTTDYHLGGRAAGRVGIIGPTRMNYSKVVANIHHISKYLDKLLEELYIDNDGE